ncbi:hypothetical protein V1505DRAFT_356672 [Lipomyces doorenjongii]
MDDLLKAFASGAARYKNDKKIFDIAYRSRLECFQETIVIHSKHWTRRTGKFAFLRYMKCAEKLPEKLYHDSRLAMERRTGHFYLCVPGPLEVVEGPAEVPRVVALDPGVRMFMTGYTPDGEPGCPAQPVVDEGTRLYADEAGRCEDPATDQELGR